MSDVQYEVVGLALLSVALLISVCLNVILCIRLRATVGIDKIECCFAHLNEGESPSQDREFYFQDPDQLERQESPSNHHEQQENPIYGNIRTERRGSLEDCYEMMTMKHKTDSTQWPLETDLNYASLDLKLANKHKRKHRHQQGHAQGRNRPRDQPSLQVTPRGNSALDVGADVDAHLPPRDTSTMVSHSSIYLNSQQIAQETEEMEREWAVTNTDMENVMMSEENGPRTVWIGAQESEGRKGRQDYSDGSECTQGLEIVVATQSDTDHFIASFS